MRPRRLGVRGNDLTTPFISRPLRYSVWSVAEQDDWTLCNVFQSESSQDFQRIGMPEYFINLHQYERTREDYGKPLTPS